MSAVQRLALPAAGGEKGSKTETAIAQKQLPKTRTVPASPVHALLGVLRLRQTLLPNHDTTTDVTRFYTQLNFLQKPKRILLKDHG
jgi:hypothetical protein